MNTFTKFLLGLITASLLIVSCGGPMPVTEPPATQLPATQAPVVGAQINDLTIILVVDVFTEIDANQSVDKETNCSVTPDGQKYRSGESATNPLEQPHGTYVYNDVIKEVQNSGEFKLQENEGFDFNGTQSQSLADSPWIKRFDLYAFEKLPGAGLLVVAVDTDGLDLNLITQNISAAFNKFNGPNNLTLGTTNLPQTTKFVVNMSFVLIPCDPDSVLKDNLENLKKQYSIEGNNIVQELKAKYYEDATIREAVNSISPLSNLRSRLKNLGYSDTVIDDATYQAFIVYLLYDPKLRRDWQYTNFYNTLKEYFYRGWQVVYVGAAGNFEDQFSYAPASWDFVVSVSSQASPQEQNPQTPVPNAAVAGLSLAEYSNWGEVQMDGVFGGDSNFASNILGTSFAAPKFSYRIARYLIDGGVSPCTNSEPALGYLTTKDPWPTDNAGVLLDSNLPFDIAMQRYCP